MKAAPRVPLFVLAMAGCNLLSKDPAPPATDPVNIEPERREPAAAPASAGPKDPGHYGVPFAWETSADEPLARARQFMADVLKDNAAFSARGREHLAQLAKAEHPRATVLACSDSRVQSSAWDATPDNDAYIVRNLGNQLATSLGSVEYGVERLKTPVLMIVGHTGCDAIEAALGDADGAQGAIAKDLASLRAKRKHGQDTDDPSDAVIANVNAQVAEAVTRFASHVQSSALTVVGAVYDLKDELDEGHGRLHFVNINGNVDEARVKAFRDAIQRQIDAEPRPKRPPASRPRPLGPLTPLGSTPLSGARATINAVSIVGGGGTDALNTGTLRAPAGRARG